MAGDYCNTYNVHMYMYPPPSLSESRVEFLEKLQRVCSQIPSGTPPQPILTSPGPTRLVVGNWALSCQREGEVTITNADGTRVSPCNLSIIHTFRPET